MLAVAKRVAVAARKRGRSRLLGSTGRGLAWILDRVTRISDRGLGIALVYHRVGDPPGDPRLELVPALGTSLFSDQVKYLASRYRLVTGSQLTEAVRERRRCEPFPVAITFDDDLASHVEVAAPVLTAAGATATYFVSGASLHGPHRFWWERLQDALVRDLDLAPVGIEPPRGREIHELGLRIQNLPPNTRDELNAKLAELVGPDPPDSGLRAESLRRLAASSGVEIGFHTRRHDLLPLLEDEELEDAMRVGRRELEDVVGKPLRTISYPHGQADEHVAAAARAAGFAVAFTGVPGAVTPASNPLLLSRLSPSYESVGELAFDAAWTIFHAVFNGRATTSPARPAHRPTPS